MSIISTIRNEVNKIVKNFGTALTGGSYNPNQGTISTQTLYSGGSETTTAGLNPATGGYGQTGTNTPTYRGGGGGSGRNVTAAQINKLLVTNQYNASPQAAKDKAFEANLRSAAESRFKSELNKVRNFNSLSSTKQKEIINKISQKVGGIYEKNLTDYYSDPYNLYLTKNRTPVNRKGKVLSTLEKVYDYVSGGNVTEKGIKNAQEALNKDVASYNQKYSGRELSTAEYRKAQQLQSQFEKTQNQIDKRAAQFNISTTKKIGNIVWGKDFLKPRDFTTAEKKSLNELGASIIKKKGVPSFVKKNWENYLNDLNSGKAKYRIVAGQAPALTPAVGLPEDVKILFTGVQRVKKGKIITDVVFKASGQRVGFAKGVTLQKGSKGFSIVLGKSGIRGIRFPSGAGKIGRVKSFIGVERSASKPSSFSYRSLISSKGGGKVSVARTNIAGILQKSAGKVASTIKGSKFVRTGLKFPTSKIVSKKQLYTLDNFASVSAAFTRGELTKIVGKTITSAGGRAEFFGLIKGAKSGSSILATLSKSRKLQYRRALQKVLSVAAAALAKSSKIKGASTASQIETAASIAKTAISNVGSKATPSQIVKNIKVQRVSPTFRTPVVKRATARQISKTRTKLKTQIAQQTKQNTRLRSKLASVSSSKSKSKLRSILRLGQRNLQKQRQALRQIQLYKTGLKQTTQQIRSRFSVPRTTARVTFPLIKLNKRKGKPRKLPKAVTTYNVYGKVGRKFKKLNNGVLTLRDALNKGAFAVDNTTARTFKIQRAGKRKKVYGIAKREKGYFNKANYKLRSYKLRKGRKYSLQQKFIEKSRYKIDTRGEKKGLTLARYLKGKGLKTRNVIRSPKPRRRISAKQRKVLLKNLKKARRVFARKRR